MSQRKLSDWIKSYEYFTKDTESPSSYWTWSGISTIAAALQRRCWFERALEKIYPNNYIIIVGPSGRARKSLPIKLAKSFTKSIGIPVLREDNSQEAIIRELAQSLQNFQVGKDLHMQCAKSAFIEELSVFTGYQNATFIAYLTDWYDSPDEWSRNTKHQGTDEVLGLYFNLLGATAPDWLPHILPREAFGGGFTSRCIFVVERKKRATIADFEAHSIDYGLRDRLQFDLERIATLCGKFTFTPEAKAAYVNWYSREDSRDPPAVPGKYFLGYNSRRHTHAIKISMAISAGRRDSLKITEQDFMDAIRLLEDVEKKMPEAFAGIGSSQIAEQLQLVMDYLRDHNQASRSQLMGEFSNDMDSNIFSRVISTLVDMSNIEIGREGKEPVYLWKGKLN